ncbi:MAG: phenylalanine--tRNA ligase subunit beta [Balneolaceae bacterium]|nr:MAG: phenylalanine--tRNA ligase subunit beta [Balneolaceae bacterium]
MKISYNWLNQYLNNPLSPEETAEKLTLLGLEVDEVLQTGSDFEGFIVGEVLEVNSHPNADKLSLCQVNTGSETVAIVCGAPNVASGQKVPVALPGTVMKLKDGSELTIRKAKIRGVESNGMICSESELGLSENHDGIMVLATDKSAGTPLADVLPQKKDYIFEIGLTPNRPDAACHIGTARDLSAVIENAGLRSPLTEVSELKNSDSAEISIEIADPDKCHRYTGIIIDQVHVEESPAWLKERLSSIGLRPINNIVDVTNFVLHETGQPLHAFDYHLIRGKKIIVKSFEDEVSFTTLDSVERKVPAGSLFICDDEGPVALAGVMGGENSEVTGSTTKILIESAWFEPSSIRKTSKALALQTDSSYRFERGIDPNLQFKAALRAALLIRDLAGGTIQTEYLDIHPVITQPREVKLRPERVNRILGTDLPEEKVEKILTKLEISVIRKEANQFVCSVPTFRPDISREIDLIEEVGRVFDYNNIPKPATTPFLSPSPLNRNELLLQKVKQFVRGLGYKEIMSNSLISAKEAALLDSEEFQIRTLNPVSTENTTLRTRLSGGFMRAVSYNLNRNATTLRFFETGRIFKKNEKGTWIDGVHEHLHLLIGLCGEKKAEDWRGPAEYFTLFDLKSDLEAFFGFAGLSGFITYETDENSSLTWYLDETPVATLTAASKEQRDGFDISRELFFAEADLTLLIEKGFINNSPEYRPIPKYPPFEFDVAFVVDKSVRAGELTRQIKDSAGELLNSIRVFDIYEGENIGNEKKSIAFRLTFLDPVKTLNMNEVEPLIKKIESTLEERFSAKMRS